MLNILKIVVYTVVIFALWVIPGARVLINPLKLFTIGWHEFCHIVAVRLARNSSFSRSMLCSQAVMTGGSVVKVTIDPDLGGATYVEGGNALAILSAGYIGSTLFGGVFVLAGFDILMAKIVSFVLGLGLVAPLALVRNKLYVSVRKYWMHLADDVARRIILLTVIYEGILVGFWFIDHGFVQRPSPRRMLLSKAIVQTSSSMVLPVRGRNEVCIHHGPYDILLIAYSVFYVVCTFCFKSTPLRRRLR